MPVFNRTVKRIQRNMVAKRRHLHSKFHHLMATELVDRVLLCTHQFSNVLELGCHQGHVLAEFQKIVPDPPISLYLQCDMSPGMVQQCSETNSKENWPDVSVVPLCVDEEALPFKPHSMDLVLSNLALHWVNELQETFSAVRQCLKPDGAFVGTMFGEATLQEFSHVMALAEEELDGGVSPHVSPFVGGYDVGSLLINTGFSIPTVDTETIEIGFKDMWELLKFVQDMGENSALLLKRAHTPKKTFERAAELYKEMYPNKENPDEIIASFEVVMWIGWHPHNSQRKAAERGSQAISLSDLAKSAGRKVYNEHGDVLSYEEANSASCATPSVVDKLLKEDSDKPKDN
eukprot:TRINITY_DN46954_c0_g1_i1.p1 TRINITY_DN46954_c0_g1~~TRINITY_DN46954_c0_g1_i1.p1  ORF type:complete len:355 (+),score=-0.62 TRINITY_DN46954_c0_g1_i1:29-1066(+)